MAAGGAYLVYKYRLRVSSLIYHFITLNPDGSILQSMLSQLDNYWDVLLLQSYMDSEIRAIMAQYMPLDSQGEGPNYVNENRA